MKHIIAMALTLITGMALYADTELIDGVTWSYTQSGGEATVTGATPCAGDMVVPETLGGATVTRIGDRAFLNKSEITKMTLPGSIEIIGDSAFESCTALRDINIPYGVTTIGARAFSLCALTKVELPDTVVSLGSEYVFYQCMNLETLRLSSNLTSIPLCAFDSCTSLKSIEIPSKVTTISFGAFCNCNAATSLVLPEGLTTIGDEAFQKCNSLTSLSIPSGTSSIDEGAFVGCSNLKSIEVGMGNTCVKVSDGCLVSLNGTTLYAAPSGNETVVIPEGIATIPAYMFSEAQSMRHIILPSTLTVIGEWAFESCSSLEDIEFPASLVSISGEGNAFVYCDNIKRVVFNSAPPAGLTDGMYSTLSRLSKGILIYPREYGAQWQKLIELSKFSGYTKNDPLAVEYVNVSVRDDDPTILDVTYRVKSSKPTVKVRALAFKDGVRSFRNVIRPSAFIEGTDANIGDNIAANQDYKLSWRVSTDWQIDLAKVKFEILVVEDDILPLELITIPANGTNKAMELSWNVLFDSQFFDALLWLYADCDSELTLSDGVLMLGERIVADGDTIMLGTWSGWQRINDTYGYYHTLAASEYVFSKMGYSVLEGDALDYAKAATRLDIKPYNFRPYAYRWIDAQ